MIYKIVPRPCGRGGVIGISIANTKTMSSLIQNKKAYFNYEILEKMEAGIELLGFEVKSLKKGQGSLEGSHITVSEGKRFLL